ncbi:MAG: VOC family protein [Actinomycetota bacterium]
MAEIELAHVGYVVKDIERGINRFEREGAVLTLEATPDPIQGVYVCLLRVDGAVDIELVSPIEPGSSPVESRLARGGGLDHLCYFVDDVEGALADDEQKGSLIVCPPTYACAFERTIGFAQRRTGLVVEYMSRETVPAPKETV